VTQGVDCLLRKREALNSSPLPPKKNPKLKIVYVH
jgi:hypothetical protein